MKPTISFGRNLDWNLLRTFHVIAESGSLTAAASKLQRKQPSISLALRRLEDSVGKQLCIRNPHRFELTPEGAQVAALCKEIFSSVNVMPDTLGQKSGSLRGTLRIVAMNNIVSASLNRALAKFHSQSPLVRAEVQIVTWGEVNRQLARKDADVGLGVVRFFRSEFKYVPVVQEFHRIYCGADHPLFGETVQNPEELSEYPMILSGGDEADVVRSYREKFRLGQQVSGISEYLDGCCQTNLSTPQKARQLQHHEAQKLNHSTRAVARFCLKDCLLSKCLS